MKNQLPILGFFLIGIVVFAIGLIVLIEHYPWLVLGAGLMWFGRFVLRLVNEVSKDE